MAEFATPEFLKNHSPEEVHALMKQVLPADIDMSPGGHAYNLTIATALIAAELCEFVLPEVIKLIFPEWSYGEFLDQHAKSIGLTRRAATAASGEITITGNAGVTIPTGSIFSTASVNDQPSVDYATLEEVTIPVTGTVTVGVECTQTGSVGNTDKNTIILKASRLTGVTAVTNEESVHGGTEIENDESLIERIVEYNHTQGESYVGSVADYKRWATSVAGVGSATVIPAQDTTGLVTIIITDANGEPATETLCEEVYNHIMKPDEPLARLAPPNAHLQVIPPATIAIGIVATVEISETTTIEAVKEAYAAALARYLPDALEAGEIKYSRVYAALSSTAGVEDFSDLQVGLIVDGEVTYGTSNIPITSDQLPTISTENLVLTVGNVGEETV